MQDRMGLGNAPPVQVGSAEVSQLASLAINFYYDGLSNCAAGQHQTTAALSYHSMVYKKMEKCKNKMLA